MRIWIHYESVFDNRIIPLRVATDILLLSLVHELVQTAYVSIKSFHSYAAFFTQKFFSIIISFLLFGTKLRDV